MVINRQRILLWVYILIACGILRAVFFFQNINSEFILSGDVLVAVEPGTTYNRLINQLADDGVIRNPFDVKLYGRLSGRANTIKAGDYILTPAMNAVDLLAKLESGDVYFHQLVLVEGWTLARALSGIQSHEMVTATLDLSDAAALQALLGTDRYPEGMIFPETYNFSRGTTDREILLRARRLMETVLQEEWATRDVGLPYEAPEDALIMASIVEKETGLASEREQIAGVFVRRLQRGMRLQTDPTVIYGLGENYDGDLTRADLRRASPYNTYLNAGLPPTPIALPGREAIHASLHPDQSDTLYFVARGDGSHYFSSTLAEHEQAIQRYQLGSEQ